MFYKGDFVRYTDVLGRICVGKIVEIISADIVGVKINNASYIIHVKYLKRIPRSGSRIEEIIHENIPNVEEYVPAWSIRAWAAKESVRLDFVNTNPPPIRHVNAFVEAYKAICHFRRCSVCGKLYSEGYVQDAGNQYFCSDECLRTQYTDQEWERECAENDQSYFTVF